MNKIPDITIYTDGACSGNPGAGGYGVVLLSGILRKELSEGYKKTTNNRMELLAVIVALEQLKVLPSNVKIYTDSRYVVDAVNQKWIYNWVYKGFKKVKNPDLWIRFLKIYKQHNVEFVWIKGHSEMKENNRCDQLAVSASQNPKNVDVNYEQLCSEKDAINCGLF